MSRYENYEIKNNVFGALSAPISSLATTIQLGDGQGQRFSENMLATLENIENGKVMKREIVLITAINGDVLTVTRKYAPCPANDDANTQGQVSYAFSTDDTISAYITKEHFDKIEDGFENTNEEIDDLHDNGTDNLRTYKTTGLGVEVKPGKILVGTSYYDFAGGTLTLTDNATNYIEIDEDGSLQVNTTGRIDENAKISKVTTSGGEVTNIEDWRMGTMGGRIGQTNIHDLTEKTELDNDDEFIIADSENIFQNKKIKPKNMGLFYGHLPAYKNISKGTILDIEDIITTDVSVCCTFGNNSNSGYVAATRITTGQDFSSVQLYIKKVGTPTSDVNVRIETDDGNNLPTGTLIDENAYGTLSKSSVTTSGGWLSIDLQSTISVEKGQVVHIVVGTDDISEHNYYQLGGTGIKLLKMQNYEKQGGETWAYLTDKLEGGYIDTKELISSNSSIGTPEFTGFSSDGTKFWKTTYGSNNASCTVYSCAIPFDTSSSNLTTFSSWSDNGSSKYYYRFNSITDDGEYIIVQYYNNGSKQLYSYKLATAWNLQSTWTQVSLTTYGSYDTGYRFFNNGTVVLFGDHASGSNNAYFRSRQLSTPYNLSSYSNTYTYERDSSHQYITTPYITDDGLSAYWGYNGTLYKGNLTTARNVSTITNVSTSTISTSGRCTMYSTIIIVNTNVTVYKYGKQYDGGGSFNVVSDGLFSGLVCNWTNTSSVSYGGYAAAIKDYLKGEIVKYSLEYCEGSFSPGSLYTVNSSGQPIIAGGTANLIGTAIDSSTLALNKYASKGYYAINKNLYLANYNSGTDSDTFNIPSGGMLVISYTVQELCTVSTTNFSIGCGNASGEKNTGRLTVYVPNGGTHTFSCYCSGNNRIASITIEGLYTL